MSAASTVLWGRAIVEHHIADEEEEMFPQARRLMDGPALDALSCEMERLLEQ